MRIPDEGIAVWNTSPLCLNIRLPGGISAAPRLRVRQPRDRDASHLPTAPNGFISVFIKTSWSRNRDNPPEQHGDTAPASSKQHTTSNHNLLLVDRQVGSQQHEKTPTLTTDRCYLFLREPPYCAPSSPPVSSSSSPPTSRKSQSFRSVVSSHNIISHSDYYFFLFLLQCVYAA